MFPRPLRLTSKDIRYIQRQRKTIFSPHFRLQYILQYPNKRYHQCSIYIAADIVHRAARRHQLKRQLLEIVKNKMHNSQGVIHNYYKLFFSLNPKNVKVDLRGQDKASRDAWIATIADALNKERSTLFPK